MTTTLAEPAAPKPQSGTTILTVENLIVRYGAIEALHGVSLQVIEGQIVTLIGANGAGKSSLLRCISALVPAAKGCIKYAERDGNLTDLCRTSAHCVVEKGISHVPEGRGIFPNMTVTENLDLGAYLRRDKAAIASDLERVFQLFPRVKERRNQMAGTMSGGEQQMLAIGRALMARPRLLLLDEPSMGISPILTERIYDTIAEINRQGTTILLVEQNANFALGVSQRGYVLETGKVVLANESSVLKEDPEVQKAYLGG